MLKQVLKYKWYVFVILILIIVEPSINSVLNFWLQSLFNSAKPGVDVLYVMRLLIIGFLLWMLKRVVVFSSGVIKTRFICNTKEEVKHNLFVAIMGRRTANISQIASSGEYISVFTNDISILESRFYNQIVSLISSIFSLAILGTSFFALSWKLATAIISFGVVSMFVPFFFSKKMNEKNLEFSNSISKFTQSVKEYIVSYPTIKNYSIEKVISEKFDEVNQETEDAKFEADYSLLLANNVGQLLSWFMQFIGVGIGIMMVIDGEILIGTVIAAQSFAGDLALPLQNIIININSIRSVKQIVKKIYDLEQTDGERTNEKQPTTQSDTDSKQLSDMRYDITFDHVGLKIGQKQIIKDFNFTFKTGKKYLVVGLNGSGKSSLFKLLKKWYEECEGGIYINDTPLSTMKNRELSHIVSYMNENVSLFSGSVKENILLFENQDEANFEQAVHNAHVCLALDRQIADEGRNISSGEQRRIEIARSLLRSSKVLVFDEVVSTLDIETAYDVERLALDLKEQTIIFVSHNFSGKLIREYDEILVIEDGVLLNHGPYEELVRECDYFRRICEIKFGVSNAS
jgi:ATP-binding cassette subfamily C protein